MSLFLFFFPLFFPLTAELGEPLEQYIQDHFPQGLVRVLRMPTRKGLIRARMKGWKESLGNVVVFFDSHMEVNIDWLVALRVCLSVSLFV